jgi:hypothetical protein
MAQRILFNFLLLGNEEASSAMLQRYVRRNSPRGDPVQIKPFHDESNPSIMLMHHFPNALLMLENADHMIPGRLDPSNEHRINVQRQ